MNSTLIEWCDRTWNPITGCPGPKVSPGCANCYAERMANTRLRPYYEKFWGDTGLPKGGPFQRMYFHYDRLDQPGKLKKPSRIFVGSMCDLFHGYCEVMWIQEIFRIMVDCPQHTFCLLTKRPERMRYVLGLLAKAALADQLVWPLPNVWLGVTVCNQEEADRLIPVLMEIPAAKRFISVEPILGPVNFKLEDLVGQTWDTLRGGIVTETSGLGLQTGYQKTPGLDWVIGGGETGFSARPSHPDWLRSLRDQCVEAGVPYFYKGSGEWIYLELGCEDETHLCCEPDGIVVMDGRFCDYRKDEDAEDLWDEPGPAYLAKKSYLRKDVQKKYGRLLDGKEWNEVPS